MAKDINGSENFHYNNIEKKDKNFMYKNFKRSNCYNCNFANSNLILQLLEEHILKRVVLLMEALKEQSLLELT